MRVPEETVCIDLFPQNPFFTSLHLKSPVHVVPPLQVRSFTGCTDLDPASGPDPDPAFVNGPDPDSTFSSNKLHSVSLLMVLSRVGF